MKSRKELASMAEQLNQKSIETFFAECDLHAELRKSIGAEYGAEMESMGVAMPNESEAKRMRQIQKAEMLREPWLTRYLPAKAVQLATLTAIPPNKQGEKFLREAIKDKALTIKMTQEKAVHLREMFKAIGYYDRQWARADKDIKKVDPATQAARGKLLSDLKAKYPKEFKEHSMLEHLVLMAVPWGANEESLTLKDVVDTSELNERQHKLAFECLRKILRVEAKAAEFTKKVVSGGAVVA